MEQKAIIKQLIYVLDCYESNKELVSNQGQALDGFSALQNFLYLVKELKKLQQ